MKQKELAAALKGIVLLCLLAGVMLCGLLIPSFGRSIAFDNPEVAWMFWPCLIGLWITCLPVLAALGLVWRIATEIGRDNSFCRENAQRLKIICCLAMADTAVYLIGAVIFFFLFRGLPPFLLWCFLAVIFVGVAIAVVSAVLSHLIQKAADLKADQDLTI